MSEESCLINVITQWSFFINPENIRKPRIFSGGMERDQWHEMAYLKVRIIKQQKLANS